MKETLRNIFYNGLYQLIIIILPLLTVPYVSRILGAQGMGINSLINSIPMLLTTVIIFGMNQLGVKVIAQSSIEERRKNFVQLWLIQALVGTIIIGMFILVTVIFSDYAFYYLLEVPFLLGSLIDISWYFIGIGQIKKVILRNSLIKFIIVSFIFMLVHSKNDLWIYLLINSVTYLANFIFWISLKKDFGIVFEKNEVHFNKLFFFDALTVALPTVAAQLYISFDQTLVGWLAGPKQLSYYALTQQMARAFITLIGSVSTVLMPKMASIIVEEKNRQAIIPLLKKSLNYTLLGSCLIVSLIIPNSKLFVTWFWGDAYTPMALDMAMGCLIVIFVSLGGVFANQYTLSRGLYKKFALPYYIGAIFSLTMNIILVPQLQSFGGTLTIILTELLVCIIRIGLVRGELPISKLLKNDVNYLIAGIVTIIIGYLLPTAVSNQFISLLFRGFIGVGSYLIVLFLMKDELFTDMKKLIH
ncbi:teichoic acid transporter [Lactiplantibacillus pentosus]|uniref:oligosaccharide flippase family protein n=1 Tax=Lactiplantibacillus pentosus TaxID=1589 RepID=UPI000D01CCB3|nr:oligosaccharide flippase family protein [Lactiplantibacillus pentosus]PRO82084.1 teichoic acid transporter [Lactiplantibacillus pentosus]PRO93018.1 teichoic acid transporter [Lactiplantibacillus pentosus]